MTKLAIAVLSCALFACGPRAAGTGGDGGGSDDGSVGLHVLTAIEVTPTNPIVELDLNQPSTQAFSAMGRFQDGNDMDISDRVNWSVVNPAVGTLTGTATLNIPGFPTTTVEVSRIKAELDGITGEAQITVVAYRRSGPAQDFFFVLPYMPPTGEVAKPLDFGTAVPALDVFFLMDTTGSMIEEINNLRNALVNTVIPGIQNAVANTMFGVGAFEDFPISPYGGPRNNCFGFSGSTLDQPLTVFSNMTNVVSQLQTAVGQYVIGSQPKGCGSSWPESSIEAMYLVATGQGLSGPGGTNVPASNIGFRPKTMPVIVTITDAISNAAGETRTCTSSALGGNVTTGFGTAISTAHTRQQAKDALRAKCARTVGIAPVIANIGNCSGEADLEDFATATGARVPPAAWDVGVRPAGCAANQCCTGMNGAGRAPDGNGLCPLVFRVNDQGAGVSTNVVTGIQLLTRFAQFDVTSERQGVTTDIDGNALPAPHTTADFIKSVTPTGFMLPPAPPVVPNPTFDASTFYGVTPSTRVQFDVKALNDFVMQTPDAQIFRATIRVVASGCADLDQREVLILVPPNPIVIQ